MEIFFNYNSNDDCETLSESSKILILPHRIEMGQISDLNQIWNIDTRNFLLVRGDYKTSIIFLRLKIFRGTVFVTPLEDSSHFYRVDTEIRSNKTQAKIFFRVKCSLFRKTLKLNILISFIDRAKQIFFQ